LPGDIKEARACFSLVCCWFAYLLIRAKQIRVKCLR